MSGPQRVVLGAWLAMIGLAAARSLGAGKGLPSPGTFLASGVLFTGYFAAAGFLGGLPAVFAVSTVLAAVAAPYFAGGNSGPLDSIAAALGKLDGTTPATTPAAAGSPGGGGGNLTP